jgi:DNA-binding transcriptional MerR regulator
MVNKTPIFNLNAVLREVNLSADVLRAWERRYQLPSPQRTAGGHRLYSEYDIEILKWLKTRQEEGLSISRAVSLWRELSASGDPLANVKNPLGKSEAGYSAAFANIDTFREQWISACMAFDATTAENILNQALSLFSIENVSLHIIQRGLYDVGEKWMTGSASVQQEHFATALAHNRLQALIAGTPAPLLDKTILIGCPSGELHTIPGLLLTLLLRREGFKVVYLGADIPVAQLTETADSIKPALIILAAQRLPSARNLAETASLLSARHHQVAYGGLVFTTTPELTARIAAHYLGDSLEGSISLIKNLVLQPLPLENPPVKTDAYPKLLADFEEHRGLIEHRVLHSMRDNGKEFAALQEINRFLGDSISAAISFGDLRFLDREIVWVSKLNKRVDVGGDIYPFYMKSYQAAVQQELGVTAAPILDWFAAIDKTSHSKEI